MWAAPYVSNGPENCPHCRHRRWFRLAAGGVGTKRRDNLATNSALLAGAKLEQYLSNDSDRRAHPCASMIQRWGVSKPLGSEISFVGAGLGHTHHVHGQSLKPKYANVSRTDSRYYRHFG